MKPPLTTPEEFVEAIKSEDSGNPALRHLIRYMDTLHPTHAVIAMRVALRFFTLRPEDNALIHDWSIVHEDDTSH